MIYQGNKAIEYLYSCLNKSDIGESSHWRKYNSNFDYNGKVFSGLDGFGSYTKFLEYPWKKNDKIIVDELCPWHKEYYSFKPPFYRKFDGPILHQPRVMSK